MSIAPLRAPLPLRHREPTPEDIPRLTALAFAAKGHWGYPEAWLDLWADELAYSPERLREETHIIAEAAPGEILGVISLAPFEGGSWEIEGLWVDPSAMGQGVGRGLMLDAMVTLRPLGCTHLRIVSDPGALGFYEGLGARLIGQVPSRPEGRFLPLLGLDIQPMAQGKMP